MVHCPLCNIALRYLIKRSDKYTLLNCPKCDLITCNPLPTSEEIRNYYSNYLFNLPLESEKTKKEQETSLRVTQIISDIKKYQTKKGKLLDLGGGAGLYAQAFAKSGYDVTYIDISSKSCAYVKKNYGHFLNIIEGDALKYDFFNRYDVLFCNQIIEHYPDVNAFLSKVGNILAEDGLIILTTPNQNTVESLVRPKFFLSYIFMVIRFQFHRFPIALWKFLKVPWLCCDPPRHLYAFNSKNISGLCLKNNFTILKIFTEYSTSQYYSPQKNIITKIKTIKGFVTRMIDLSARIAISFIKTIDKNELGGGNLVIYCTKKDTTEQKNTDNQIQ